MANLQEILTKGSEIDELDLKNLAAFYGIEGVDFKPDKRGIINITLIGRKWVATLFRKKDTSQVANLAQIVNQLEGGLMPKPKKGVNGFVSLVKGMPALVCNRLQGSHYVGHDHADKRQMPNQAHRSVAKAFWKLHSELGHFNAKQNSIEIEEGPIDRVRIKAQMDKIAANDEIHRPLTSLLAQCLDSETSSGEYPSLVHGDMERQNVLFGSDNNVNGVVDLDALKKGDLLYEFGHFLFNFACCDPNFKPKIVELYLEEMIRAGIIKVDDIGKIYSYICSFVASDIISFIEIAKRRSMNLTRLIEQYRQALTHTYNYFYHA